MKVIIAETWLSRAGGLLIRPALLDDEVLWLRPCQSIHTFGMRDAIGVFFLNQHNLVISTRPYLRPNRIAYNRQARSVVETRPFLLKNSESMAAQLERVLSSTGGV